MIRLEGLEVEWPGFRLGPLDLEVRPGERVALVGANGAGKSTLLHVVAGLLTRYRGTARVRGREVREEPVLVRRGVGVVPERLGGFVWKDVAGHLRFLEAFHPAWDRDHAEALRERLDLPAHAPLGALSKGMRVKLSWVSAESFRPPVLALDEPTSGIDPAMRDSLLALVDEVAPRGGGRSVLFSTHLLEDVEHLADRVALLDRGRLLGCHALDDLPGRGPSESCAGWLRRRLGRV